MANVDNKKTNNNKKKKVVNKRAKSLKLFSISSVLIVLAIIIVFNVLLTQLLDTALTFDLSAISKNSASEETIQFIDSLPDDTNVRIVGLFDKPSLSVMQRSAFEYIVPMLDDLAARSNGKVTVDYVNPDTYPNIISELDNKGVANLQSGLFAVCCNGKIRTIDPYADCFSYMSPEQYGYAYPKEIRSEAVFVNTIRSLTSESSYKVYYLTGLQEASHQYLDSIFSSLNIEVAELPAEEPFAVPDDCSLLIINNPTLDISESVQESLKSYIHNGKNPVNIICSVGITKANINEKFPHLNNVLAEVNLNISSYYIEEADPEHIYSAEAGVYRGELTDSYINLNGSGDVRYSLCRNVVEVPNGSVSISTAPMIVTSDTCTAYDPSTEDVQYLSNANIARAGFFVGTDNPVNVFAFGTSAFTSDVELSQVSSQSYNVQTIRNLIDGIFGTESNVNIPVKDYMDYSLDAEKINQNVFSVMSVIFIAVVPLSFVIIAAFVYNKRSHL